MSTSLLPKKKHRHVLDLQLTAMIDIFSLIVIFLIKSTVFGVSDVQLSPGLKLPISKSKESLETAPRAQIVGDKIVLSIAQGESARAGVPISSLATEGATGRAELIAEIKSYISKLSTEARGSGVLLSLLADRNAEYEKVFQAVRFFREAGFDSVLFVAASGEEK